MHKLRAGYRRSPVFTESGKSRHNALPIFAECGIMAMTYVWAGVAVWLAFNAAVTVCLVAAEPGSRRRAFARVPYRI